MINLKVLICVATILLAGCSRVIFDENRYQENKIFLSYNTSEVRILEVNGKPFPKFSPFAENALDVSSGLIKLKVKLHWVDTYVGTTYRSSLIKDLCFISKPGYSYYVWADVFHDEAEGWKPYVRNHEGPTETSCT